MFEFYRNALQGRITDPLCADYKNDWRKRGEDRQALIDFVLRQQSIPYFLCHCNAGFGLSKEYLMDAFRDYINGNYATIDADGVEGGNYKSELYVGFEGVLSLSADVICCMWSNIHETEITPAKATKIYVGCHSDVHITCNGYNSIIVMLFDDSKIWVDRLDKESTITIYRYSDKASIEIGADCAINKVRTFDKEIRL